VLAKRDRNGIIPTVTFPPMRPRFRLIVAVGLCFLATGAQWDFVQTFAWGRMVVNYSHTMTLRQSIARTFSGEMCDVCRLVAGAKKSDPAHSAVPEARTDAKLFLFLQHPAEVVIDRPNAAVWSPVDESALTADRSAPPRRPPRSVAA
jgi:hypothetical protein